jgi:transposase-like protein
MEKETIKQAVEQLKKEESIAREKIARLRQTIDNLQKLCEVEGHYFEEVGHDSHKTRYECKWCGYTEDI